MLKALAKSSFYENCLNVKTVSQTPLARRLETNLCAKGLSNAQLEGPEVLASLLLEASAQCFSGQASQNFANCYRS